MTHRPRPRPSAGPGAPAAAGRLQAIKQAGALRICTTGDYRPFSYLDPGTRQFSGIDIDMAKDLAKRLKVAPMIVQTSWSTLMPDFLAKCDIGVGGISISLERAEQAAYSSATLTEGKTPITRCENVEKFDTVAEINQPNVRSITPIGGTNEKFAAANYPQGQIIRFADNNKIFDEILAGRADVMTTDASETKWVANTKPGLCAVHPDQPFDFSQKAYLLPQGDVAFKQYVDQWLVIAEKDGTLAAATKPWYG
ncbi:transporter substrate-binding domain-containing protein [Enemella evansiae]|uniref:transporter substrate-binding domain-containing protein n=1 Tax=Enemella evansiae TaxID=2016499 RepID=UPI0010D705A0|nr:transporter substrate-binding domain-containing protein [Enemella evansiae]TDO89940.1 cyclohexadienyl dehydratase [Enemella evansiae]